MIRHYGWPVSPYTAKTRAYLDFKGLDFLHERPTARTLFGTIRRAVGRPIMPTVQLDDGRWLQDSSVIIDHFEATLGPTMVPPSPTQRIASALVEFFADEWMPMVSLHTRWNIPENERYAIDAFARLALPWAPLIFSRPLARRLAARMKGYRAVLGITPATAAALDTLLSTLIHTLEQHLQDHAYLLGAHPCIGDFALMGQLWAHPFSDPATRTHFDEAPAVRSWLQRLREGPRTAGSFLEDDVVPESLDPLFLAMKDQHAWVRTLVQHIDEWCAAHPDAKRVPRALGRAPFTIGGIDAERTLVTFVQWKAQRPRQALEEADASSYPWLDRLFGHRDPIPSIRNPFRLENHRAVLAHPPLSQAPVRS